MGRVSYIQEWNIKGLYKETGGSESEKEIGRCYASDFEDEKWDGKPRNADSL